MVKNNTQPEPTSVLTYNIHCFVQYFHHEDLKPSLWLRWLLDSLYVIFLLFLLFFLHAEWRAVAQKNPSVQYYAGVGVNAYVSVHLSFLPEAEKHNTRAVARTFCPEFEHHVEFPCNLVIQKSSGEASCLGELLQSANIVFSIYHQSTKSGKVDKWQWLNAVAKWSSPLNF